MKGVRRFIAWCLRHIEGFLYWHVGTVMSDWFGERARQVERGIEE
jgi:hypothetical protein